MGVYQDNDTSAYSGKARPGYRALLADLEADLATGVLVWHTDRLHRSPVELERYITISEARGIVTHSVTAGPLDLSTAAGRMQARIVGAVARHESEQKSERIRRQRQQNAESGGWHGGARPFGFGADGVTHREPEAEVIRAATTALLAGTSLRSVVRTANESGLSSTFGHAWSVVAFREVLLRSRNAGLRTHRGEVIGPGAWQPIVEEYQWRAVVSMLTDPNRRTSPGNRAKWLGSGLYVCGACGRPSLRVSTAGSRRAAAYRCRQPGPGHVVRTAVPLDNYVCELIVARLSAPDAIELLRPAKPNVDLDALKSDANAARARLTELAAMLGAGELTRAEHGTARGRAQDRLQRAEQAVTEATIPSPLDHLAGAPDVAAVWAGLDLGRRRAVLSELMTVTVLPILGERPRGGPGFFDHDAIAIEWKSQ